MSTSPKSETHGQRVRGRYETYGLFGGLWLGALLGVLYGGPNFTAWQVSTSLLVVLGSAAGGALVGFLAVAITTGSLANGPGGGSAYGEGGNGDPGVSAGPGDGAGGGDG